MQGKAQSKVPSFQVKTRLSPQLLVHKTQELATLLRPGREREQQLLVMLDMALGPYTIRPVL